jgi:hypothetical protein
MLPPTQSLNSTTLACRLMRRAAGALAVGKQRAQKQAQQKAQQQAQQQAHAAAAALLGKLTARPDLQYSRRQQGMGGKHASRAWHQPKLLEQQPGTVLRPARLRSQQRTQCLRQHCQATSRQQDLHHVLPALRLKPT